MKIVTDTASVLGDVTEKEWAAQVAELAALLGWRRYHTYRSSRSPAGWPDEAFVRDRLILLELKTETGRLSPAQCDWIRALLDAGVEAYVCRPADLDDLAKILACRADPFSQRGPARDAAAHLHAKTRSEVPVPAD